MRLLILLLSLLPASAQVEMKPSDGRIAVIINGKPFTELWYGPETRKPYLHPLRAADGKVISRHYPMAQVEGEPKDHPHHRGLWFNHGGVNGVDFWMSDPLARGDNGARIALVESKPIISKGGRDKGDIRGQFEWRDKEGNALLREDRVMTFYAEPELRTIDFDITLTALKEAKFLDTKEGSFGLRLAPGLQEEKGGTGKMVNAEGAEGEKNVWGKRSPWVDYSGTLEGTKVGVAIFDHPSNPRHPTYWHARGYGLFAANIFGLHDFNRDKTADGSLTLKAGEALHFRYRVLIHPGDTQSAKIGDEYKRYAGQNPSAAARVADFALLAGHWQGKIGSAEIEEVWTAPGNGGMIGMFRLMQNGRLGMSEFMTVDETPEGAVMHMRHFAAGLKPREEQALVWQVVEKGNNKLLLRTGETELRLHLEAPDALTAVLIKGGKETAFRYRRVAAANPTSDR